MTIIKTSAEHHFLALIDDLKNNSEGWIIGSFSFPKAHTQEDLQGDYAAIADHMAQDYARSEAFAEKLLPLVSAVENGNVYLFTDSDVIFLGHVAEESQRGLLEKSFGELAQNEGAEYAGCGRLKNEIYAYQKLADQKMLSAKLAEAYEKIGDKSRVSSIVARRNRREYPLVLVIEDDRFTGSYAANILSKDYDMLLCKTGEEGIASYIEHAPDVVFIDIHLPGINGHHTLQAIRAVDPQAFAVMLSVDTVKENILGATRGGARNFLKKPFSKERLLNAVQTSPHIRGIEVVSAETVAAT